MNNILKKNVVFFTVFLILGLITTTCITGQINNKSFKENPILLDFDYDDYLIGYWKFDEGSGSTAGDSSGNDYDGTIYGASWITGYSNNALDFDGTNDYVDLDDYAVQLGFNKTDDMIFSLYFKTSMNSPGVIYSTSHPWDYNPGVHIAMNSNGTLEFKVWVLSCGVTMSSQGIYNDGEWHYLEIWYNGISANPTITIYVDGEEDIIVEHWICSFENNEFGKFKMGKCSYNETLFFDGAIDEVKIFKFAGGNEQNPPDISGPSSGEVNQNLEYTFTTDDPEEDEVYIYVDWGDESNTGWIGPFDSGETVSRTHKYTKNGSYKIKAKSKDIWDDSTWSNKIVRIGNQAPSNPSVNGPLYGEPGSEYTYTFKSSDFEEDNVWYWIDWGDGNIDEWLGGEEGYEHNTSIDVNHIWDVKGFYEITAKAKDIYNQESEETTYSLRMGNDAPEAPSVTGPQTCELDIEYEYRFVASDSEEDTLIYFVNWGDGHETNDIGPFASGDPVVLTHKWHNKGTFTIKAKVQDQIGDFSEEGTLKVSAPKSKGFYFSFSILQWIFEHFPFEFSILRNLLGANN